jgi:chloramphenicol-sensitive protein RarD
LNDYLKDESNQHRIGVACGLAAYGCWGFIPLYFKEIEHVSAMEILCHRVLWTLLLLALFKLAIQRNGAFRALLRDPRRLVLLFASGTFIAINWLVFTWAATHDRVMDTSLGYFINPLFSVFLGVVFLRERLRPAQIAAVSIAGAALVLLVLRFGQLPWISLCLAASFGMYGFIRKLVAVDAFTGLFTETLLMAPFLLLYLGLTAGEGNNAFIIGNWTTRTWLILAGPITTIPLAMFAMAARRVYLSTLGFMQYLAPSITLILAVAVFGEPFGTPQIITFSLIWLALGIYTADSLGLFRRRAVPEPVLETE